MKTGYSLDDAESLLTSVEKYDLPYRNQSWVWLARISGIPETTVRRILKDDRKKSVSLLSIAAEANGYEYYTKAKKYYSHLQKRTVIISVCKEPAKRD